MINNAKLMKASAWGKREFEENSVPDNRTIKHWIEIGKLKGKIIDGSVWVNSSERWGVESSISSCVSQLIRDS
ncbi:hypothetical protein GPY51_10810 [Photorhabdus laumondii subsp. laumondii]|uniref:Photorhabdus luminescens subsp. laumondii TTO1 complete genome segment 10/17 n=2 Tax=Photorhabdus laumondii subsp. laumondii TaxID=141679 RepID=Q7N2X7_PHOLL|nr:hypothetical protein [Photorhabdus laumondii]AWK42656.1 hypothetical protein A4R40_14720 [Photorhabdus laumondii subsp. laumondii]AXG47979.1 hypothetical protein PluTT01m_15140 [Photorhabdus laumondii subsp. laumondii]MCC8384635.1 hypothetical protein [Photorhabdus laumondii]MCC8413319.1 hypothetical protein [Photorhabdus laumondii]NDK94984.1 hypothetical protein [Photorhabdus laumondii subsp. laumondii]